MVIALMGVSGAGKTTIGRLLAAQLGWTFVDADDLHPTENVARMRAGEPLDERHRVPWIEAVAEALGERAGRGEDVVLACSALRESHRARIGRDVEIRWVWLSPPRALVADRLARRTDHFMPGALLDTQLDALEPPDDVPRVENDGPPVETVERIRAVVGR